MSRREGGKGKNGKHRRRRTGSDELLIDGLWLAYIMHYLGWAPELICVRQRGLIPLCVTVKGPSQMGSWQTADNTNHSDRTNTGQTFSIVGNRVDLDPH